MDVKGVLRILLDEFSLQQETLNQVLVRLSSLEDTSNKQQLLLNKLKSAILKPKNHDPKENVMRSKIAQARKIVHQASRNKSSIAAYKALKFHSRRDKSHRERDMTRPVSPRGGLIDSRSAVKRVRPDLSLEQSLDSRGSKDADHLGKRRSVARDQDSGSRMVTNPWNVLSRSGTDLSTASAIDDVMYKYRDLVLKGKVVSLARKLALEAVIGEDTLKKCTTSGDLHYPALPVDSLETIKQAIFNYFPDFWEGSDDFEKHWTSCLKGIEHLCSALRQTSEQQQTVPQNAPTPSSGPALKPVVNPIVGPPGCVDSPSVERTPFTSKSDTKFSPPAYADIVAADQTGTKPARKTRIDEKSLQFSSAGVGKGPKVKPIGPIKSPLPSCEIPKSELMSLDDFMAHYSFAIADKKYSLGLFSVKLASEVIFGRKVLSKCSPSGRGPGLNGLPLEEFNMLKQLVLDCCPSLWDSLPEFEKQWNAICKTQLSCRCANLRWQLNNKRNLSLK